VAWAVYGGSPGGGWGQGGPYVPAKPRGEEALALACDVTNPDEVERVVAAAEESFGTVNIVVNNSETTWGGTAGDAR
jgi:NAD(P)-dependent dehydrogenase (short-subunit alcohol dehydrogenase family)